MDNPRLTGMLVQYDAVNVRQREKKLFHLLGRQPHLARQIGVGRARAVIDQTAN